MVLRTVSSLARSRLRAQEPRIDLIGRGKSGSRWLILRPLENWCGRGCGPAVGAPAEPSITAAGTDSDEAYESGFHLDEDELVDMPTDCASGQCEGSTSATGEIPPRYPTFMTMVAGQTQEDAAAVDGAVWDSLRGMQADAERALGRLSAHHVVPPAH